MSDPSEAEAQESQPRLHPVPTLALARSEGGGGGHPVLRIAAAAFFVMLCLAAYVHFEEKPPVVAGDVLHLSAYPVHRVSHAAIFATQSIAPAENTFDEILVVADIRLRNQSDGPIFFADASASLKLPSEEQRSNAASAVDFNRVFLAYPQLTSMKRQPLLRDTTLPAGATLDGQLVFHYPIAKALWEQRKSLDITLSFTHQKDLVLPAPQ
jgi:hypothetical protein